MLYQVTPNLLIDLRKLVAITRHNKPVTEGYYYSIYLTGYEDTDVPEEAGLRLIAAWHQFTRASEAQRAASELQAVGQWLHEGARAPRSGTLLTDAEIQTWRALWIATWGRPELARGCGKDSENR